MRVTTNDKLIERQSKIARYATLGGLLILGASLVTSFTGNFSILVSYALLVVGFGLAYIGAVFANRWVKEPRADNALTKAMKGFDNKFHLFNYLLPADHVLITPTGLVVFKVKANDGVITCQNDKWRTPFRLSRLFGGMGQEPLGNPVQDMGDDINRIKALIADRVENAGIVPVDGYIIFTDPRAQLNIDSCSAPVVRVEDIKDTLRKAKHGPVLAPPLLENLEHALSEEADAKAAK